MRGFVALLVGVCLAVPCLAQESDVVEARSAAWLQQLATKAGSPQPNTHECFNHTNLSCNTSVADTVNIFGCATSNLGYFNVHRFFLNANTKVTISMQSFSYSPLIVLTNDDATATLASANAPTGGTASVTYTTTSSAYYLALVGPLANLATGTYTLSMTCTAVTTGTCVPSTTTLCLNSRFAVSVTWKDFNNNTGTGKTIPMTSDTGAFWFFGSTNYELMLKILDARTLNNRYWVFYGALSTVEYTITVRDTVTNRTKTYFNKSGNLGSVADTDAFTP